MYGKYQLEWNELQHKIKLLKKANQNLGGSFSHELRNKCSETNPVKTKTFENDVQEEARVINKCYKESLLFFETQLQRKRRKKALKDLKNYHDGQINCLSNPKCSSIKNETILINSSNCLNNSSEGSNGNFIEPSSVRFHKEATNTNTTQSYSDSNISSSELNKSILDYVCLNSNDTVTEEDDVIIMPNDCNIKKTVGSNKNSAKFSSIKPIVLNKCTSDEIVYIDSINSSKFKIHSTKNESIDLIEKQNTNFSPDNEVHGKTYDFGSASDDTEDKDVLFIETDNLPEFSTKNKNITKETISKDISKNIPCIDVSDDEITLLEDDDWEDVVIPDLDLTEEPVDFDVPILHLTQDLNSFTQDKLKDLRSKGIKIRRSRWTKEEEEILLRNFHDFKTKFGLGDTRLLLGMGSTFSNNRSQLKKVKHFIHAKHFYVRLGKDLEFRTLRGIYNKARRLLDPLNQRKDKVDLATLFSLVKKYGHRWELIARKIGLPALKCYYLYENNINTLIKGRWTAKEIKKLYSAIENQMSTGSRVLDKKSIDWNKVSTVVKTRNPFQCYKKWYFDLKCSTSNHEKWSKEHKTKLVFLLRNKFSVDNEVDVDWEGLYLHFRMICPSIWYLRERWRNIKRPYSCENQSFKQLIDTVAKIYCKNYI